MIEPRVPVVWKARRRERGFGHVSLTLEAAAILGWFAVLVLGEKLLGDATAARRAAERSVAQAVAATAATYCEETETAAAPSAGGEPISDTTVALAFRPDATALLSVVQGLGVGREPTFGLYTAEIRSARARATQEGVRGAAEVDDRSHTFEGQRALACPERTRDSSKTSIAKYRASVFDQNIKGY